MGDEESAAGLRTLLSVIFMSLPNNIAICLYRLMVANLEHSNYKDIVEMGIYAKITFSFIYFIFVLLISFTNGSTDLLSQILSRKKNFAMMFRKP